METSIIGSSRDEGDGLNLGNSSLRSVGAEGHDIVPVGAHAGCTVDSRPPSVADTSACAVRIPGEVTPGDGGARTQSFVGCSASIIVVSKDGSEGKLIHVLTRTVAGATVGAGLASASLSLKASKAFTLTSLTVANSLTGTLGIVVGGATLIRSSGPRELKWTETKIEQAKSRAGRVSGAGILQRIKGWASNLWHFCRLTSNTKCFVPPK